MLESQNWNLTTTGCSPLFLDPRNLNLDEDLQWMALCVVSAERGKEMIDLWHKTGEIDFDQRAVMMRHVHIREIEEGDNG